jgi:hypothetical protein
MPKSYFVCGGIGVTLNNRKGPENVEHALKANKTTDIIGIN